MKDKELFFVNINLIEDSFGIVMRFEAELLGRDKNSIFLLEKNPQKNEDSLARIVLYTDMSSIMLRVGIAYISFKVKEGNLEDFRGEYKVSMLGRVGKISVLDHE